MNHAFVLQDETGYAVGVAYEEPKARQLCKENNWSYRLVPFYWNKGTEVHVIAGPIDNIK
ncbi:MAG: hypothetical protein HXX16_17180 [Bacteroidales bacterium]|nr:hypothetical protein [Bacteroidales bacterium]